VGRGEALRVGVVVANNALAVLAGPAALAVALEVVIALLVGSDRDAGGAVQAGVDSALLAVAGDVLAEVAEVAGLADAVERLLGLLGRFELEAGAAVEALDLLAVVDSGGEVLASAAVVVFDAGAEVSSVASNATRSAVQARVDVAVRALLSGSCEGDGTQAEEGEK